MSEMLERTSFDTPTLPRLAIIIAELQRGVYQIPEFQRPSVWEDDQRLGLMDSIAKGLPIGSILVWRSSKHVLQTYPSVAGIPVPRSPKEVDKRTYLIDGHQRISTLFGALVRPTHPRTGRDAKRWPIYYELGTSESPAFKLPPVRGEVPAHWLPLDILLDNRALFRFRERLFAKGEDARADEVERIANVFKDYIIPVVPLVTETLDLVTDAFVRINSQGSDMTEAHMLRALTFLKGDIDTDRGFKRIREALEPLGWGEIPDQPLVNSLKAALDLDVYRSSVTEVNAALQENPTALLRLQKALLEAVSLLANIGVRGWGALPYAYQFVTLAALAYRDLGSLQRKEGPLRQWFWRTTYTEHFTGQTGGQIRREIDVLSMMPDDGEADIAKGVDVPALSGKFRQGTVRIKAFLLFLASKPSTTEARERRQEVLAKLLGSGRERRALSLIIPKLGAIPGNIVLAEQVELGTIRKTMTSGHLSSEQADEFAVQGQFANASSLESQRTPQWMEQRTAVLIADEATFIRSFGISITAGSGAERQDEGDDDDA